MAMLNNQRVEVSKCDTSQQPNPAARPIFRCQSVGSTRGNDAKLSHIRVTAIAALQQICRLWQPPLSHLVGGEHNEHITSITRLDTTSRGNGNGTPPVGKNKHDSSSYIICSYNIL